MSAAVSNSPFIFSPVVSAARSGEQPPSAGAWINETRREISEIVREVAQSVRQPQPKQKFLTFLVDRMLRAMSAEGVVIWQRHETSPSSTDPIESSVNGWKVATRLGRITDQSFDSSETLVHALLLDAVVDGRQPVVVPSTPGANELGTPANPASVPAAIVPVDVNPSDDGPEYLFEIFIEPDGGIATQRGYLRFIAQMADLAGEFFRADEMRRLKQRQQIESRIETLCASFHGHDQCATIAAQLVDGIAELFGFDRVGLCRVHGKRVDLIAVSFVETIAHGSPAAEQIRFAAVEKVPDTFFDLRVVDVVVSPQSPANRLVCLTQDPQVTVDESTHADIERCLRHANMALINARRLAAVPGFRWWSSLVARGPAAPTLSRRIASLSLLAGIILTALVVALFPVPLVVVASGTLRSQSIENFCATRSTVVQAVHVEHGQHVVPGDVLVTLSDDDLEQQITTLLGRRAVLVEQQIRWTQALVDTASHRLDRTGQLQNERDLVAEELRSIDQQLVLLEQVRESLTLRTTREGTVDAWQLKERISGRPLQRGDFLLSVIDSRTNWAVDTRVPQNRISTLVGADREQTLDISVILPNRNAMSFAAMLKQLGPPLHSESDGSAMNAVLVSLTDPDIDSLSNELAQGPLNGTPAQVICKCGRMPLAYVLLQDAITSIRARYQMYFGSLQPNSSGEI